MLPDSAIGKRAKCKKCGAVFTVEAPEEEGPIPIADEPFPLAGDLDSAIARGEAPPTSPPTGFDGAAVPPAPAVDMSKIGEAYKPPGRSYWQNLFWTFLFPASPGNLVTFIALWFALTFLPLFGALLPCAGFILAFILQIIVLGMYCAVRFSIIESAAGGDEDLPGLTFNDGIWEDILLPMFRWIGSWLVVQLPALLYYFYGYWTTGGTLDLWDVIGALVDGLTGMIGAGDSDPALVVLAYAGLFLWPMVVLCVALGGFDSLKRLDLIFVTIGKTFPIYLLTVGLVFGTELLGGYIHAQVAGKIAPTPSGGFAGIITTGLAILAVGNFIMIYFEIVAMRAIGLYYHHFKHRFAWDWG
jgi:hypothetical protein